MQNRGFSRKSSHRLAALPLSHVQLLSLLSESSKPIPRRRHQQWMRLSLNIRVRFLNVWWDGLSRIPKGRLLSRQTLSNEIDGATVYLVLKSQPRARTSISTHSHDRGPEPRSHPTPRDQSPKVGPWSPRAPRALMTLRTLAAPTAPTAPRVLQVLRALRMPPSTDGCGESSSS